MTAPRQERNARRCRVVFIPVLAVISSLVSSGLPARAGMTERVVVSRHTGLAIGGFDPVAYFTDARPIPGLPAIEVSEAGAVWRFSNEGSRSAFAAHPDIYGPQFGGYDPVDIARGVKFPGNPQLWAISAKRLYLFGRDESRDAFLAAPGQFLDKASRLWPDLQETLAR